MGPRLRKLEARKRVGQVGLAIALVLGAMAAPAQAGKTQEQKDWIARQKAQPLTFTLPDSEAGAAWLRAKIWIATNGKSPVQIADENLIQTERGINTDNIELDPRPQMSIMRAQLASGEWTFAVNGRGVGVSPAERKKSLHVLAFHVADGRPYPGDPEDLD